MFWLLLIVIITFILFLFMTISVTLNLSYDYQSSLLIASVNFYNMKIYNREVCLPKIDIEKIWSYFISSEEPESNYIGEISQIKEKVLSFISNSKISYIEWNTLFGRKESDKTAILIGLLWITKGSLIGVLDAQGILSCKPSVHIRPHFNEIYFETELTCILSMKVGQAINCLLKNRQ